MQPAIYPGFTDAQRPQAADLFWQAFRDKLGPVMRPEEQALGLLRAVADPGHAIRAEAADGTLLGLAGFKTEKGAFIGGGMGDLASAYGWPGALWRAPLLALLERDSAPGTLLMDGIFVTPEARGQGIGTKLLSAIKAEAARRGLVAVRLDVIDSNPRARALYEREGFIPGDVHDLGPLRHIFGFRSATTMIWTAAA
ncbi:MAG: GNAT family N-acetyltransferase [Albidovulum sp.]|uniref:GNAT family N-acetyltransferase n=1 Tax=Albidovulum sp. TaxID=1872424 RepID=UPI003CBDA97A